MQIFMSPEKKQCDLFEFRICKFGVFLPFCVTNLVNQGEKSRLYSTDSADSTSMTDDRLNRSIRLSPTLSTQLDSNVKRSTRSISGSSVCVCVSICLVCTLHLSVSICVCLCLSVCVSECECMWVCDHVCLSVYVCERLRVAIKPSRYICS